ncbi:hypothetical protein BDR26DRAFT_862228 [Obelidium mucronatum]|nr:hypothetical protein BDR26DRAFT_862228 [Obelidium mucronatum]
MVKKNMKRNSQATKHLPPLPTTSSPKPIAAAAAVNGRATANPICQQDLVSRSPGQRHCLLTWFICFHCHRIAVDAAAAVTFSSSHAVQSLHYGSLCRVGPFDAAAAFSFLFRLWTLLIIFSITFGVKLGSLLLQTCPTTPLPSLSCSFIASG